MQNLKINKILYIISALLIIVIFTFIALNFKQQIFGYFNSAPVRAVASQLSVSFTDPTPLDNSIINYPNYAYLNTSIADSDPAANLTGFIDCNDSLVGWWRFNNETGESATLFKDWSSYDNNGTCSGTTCPSLAQGKFGSALNSSGNDSIAIADSNNLDLSKEISIELWFNIRSYGADTLYASHPIRKYTNPTDANYVMYLFGPNSALSGTSAKKIGFYGNANGVWAQLSPLYPIDINAWYHIVWTYSDIEGGKLYVNGIYIGVSSQRGALTTNATGLKIGGDSFNGMIDNLKIWNKVLTQADVKSLYSARPNPPSKKVSEVSAIPYNCTAWAEDSLGSVSQSVQRSFTITNDTSGKTDSIVMDLGKESSIYSIEADIYSKYSADELLNQNFLFSSAANPPSLPVKDLDYGMDYDGESQLLWILANDSGSSEYIVARRLFSPMVDLSVFPFLAYKVKAGDPNVRIQLDYIEVSDGSNSTTVVGFYPEGYDYYTNWVIRGFNAYQKALSAGNYRYLKAVGYKFTKINQNFSDNAKHYGYINYMTLGKEKSYNIYLSSDNTNWELVKTQSLNIPAGNIEKIIFNNIWETSKFSKARYVKIESPNKDLWIENVNIKKSPIHLLPSTATINHVAPDNDSFMFITPDAGSATFNFEISSLSKLAVTDNSKLVIYYDNGVIFKETGWDAAYNNGVFTLNANLVAKYNYIMLDINPQQETVSMGSVGNMSPSEVDYFANTNFDWYWYQSYHASNKINLKNQVSNLTSKHKKVIFRVWWWDHPTLKDKTWTDLYNNPDLLNIAINETLSQIEAVGKDNFYAVSLSEEEPDAGFYHYNWYYGGNAVGILQNNSHYIEMNNKIYDAVKNKYPDLKVLAGAHVDGVMSGSDLLNLKRDGVVDDRYSPLDSMDDICGVLKKEQDIYGEVYFVMWAAIYDTTPGYRILTPDYVKKAFEICKIKGLKNIGFFNHDAVRKKNILFNDSYNPTQSVYLRPELYKETMMKLTSKYSMPFNSLITNPTPTFKSADLNQDGIVNSVDFGILMSYWNSASRPKADLNQDGIVNSVDFGIMMSKWG